jgi:cystathionine gamma-lyase
MMTILLIIMVMLCRCSRMQKPLPFPTGMAAIAGIFYTQLKPGNRLSSSDGHCTTRSFAEKCLAPIGVSISKRATVNYETADLNGFQLVWVETPSNPGLEPPDSRSVVAKAKKVGVPVAVGNSDTLLGHIAS